MKNSASKILALLLSLVLICTLAVAAFAATYDEVEEPFKFTIVTGYAEISRYSTSVSMSASSNRTDIVYDGTILSAYTYYPLNHSSIYNYTGDYISQTFCSTGTDYSKSKTYNSGQICSMRDANATFEVIIDTVSGSFIFEPDALHISYPHPTH